MNLSIGEVTSINWTSKNSFFLSDRMGMVHFFDTRCSFKNNTSVDKIDSSLSKISTSQFCKENNMVAFGSNQNKVLLFDIRNIRKKYKEFNVSCSKMILFLLISRKCEFIKFQPFSTFCSDDWLHFHPPRKEYFQNFTKYFRKVDYLLYLTLKIHSLQFFKFPQEKSIQIRDLIC
jgi:WD40 repeat protein